jgi:hypothetical protein
VAADQRMEISMEKIFILTALTFLITTGTAAVMTVHPHLAMACNTAGC